MRQSRQEEHSFMAKLLDFLQLLIRQKKREQASVPRVWVTQTQTSMTAFRLNTLIQWLEEMNLVILDGDIPKEVLVKSSGI